MLSQSSKLWDKRHLLLKLDLSASEMKSYQKVLHALKKRD